MQAVMVCSAALIGVTISIGGAFAQNGDHPKQIALKCPSENGGVLELLTADSSKTIYRIRVKYDNSEATVVSLAKSPPGEPFATFQVIDLRTETDGRVRRYGEAVAKRTNDPMLRVCLGTQQSREEYFALLRANRAALGLR